MIFVTHDQVEAMTMADRIVVMKNGRVQQVGTPNELYESPVNLFVADFIGSPAMNFLKGRLVTNGNSLEFGLWDEQNLELSNLEIERGSEASGSTEKMVIIGLRPEHLLITGVESGIPGIRAKVRSIEPLGGEAIVHVDLYKNLDQGNYALAPQVDAGDANDSELLSQLRNQLVIKTQGQFRFKIGEEIVISLNSDASAYLFDIETQLAITGIVRKS
jgi:ABC-type sugar transport system ATPase subunit